MVNLIGKNDQFLLVQRTNSILIDSSDESVDDQYYT
jgi:hypothetical protein